MTSPSRFPSWWKFQCWIFSILKSWHRNLAAKNSSVVGFLTDSPEFSVLNVTFDPGSTFKWAIYFLVPPSPSGSLIRLVDSCTTYGAVSARKCSSGLGRIDPLSTMQVFYFIIILINDNQWTSVIIGFSSIKRLSFIVRIVFLILGIFSFNIDCSYAIYLFRFSSQGFEF